jgi:hypothetical protein
MITLRRKRPEKRERSLAFSKWKVLYELEVNESVFIPEEYAADKLVRGIMTYINRSRKPTKLIASIVRDEKTKRTGTRVWRTK